MAAGHITPITLTIPTELPVSYVDFSVTGDSSNLGEEPYNLIIKAPEGMTFRNGTTEQTFPIDESTNTRWLSTATFTAICWPSNRCR